MPNTPPVSTEDLARYPGMTGWFQPTLLAKLLWRVIVSELFGQYADGRLMVAALDTVKDDELVKRARQFMPGVGDPNVWTFTPDEDGAVWVDYVADLADGFDSTYAIASLIAQERLEIDGFATRRGQLLAMGGDEVYPTATLESYQRKLRDPYGWAFPDPDPDSPKGPPVFALPGNHDWYDGLVQFMGLFARRQQLHLGGWRAYQHRSYFALQLTESWWIWGVDAQLVNAVDQSQKDYFAAVARAMPEGARIILCGPEPGWVYPDRQGAKAFAVLDSIARIAVERRPGVTIPLVIAGDSHHYSRYEGRSADGAHATHFVTSGGGGAFLHGTHHLPREVALDETGGAARWLDGAIRKLTLGRDGAAPGREAIYPSRTDSVRMLAGVFLFTLLNPTFALMLGVFYWLAGLLTWHAWPDALYLTPAIFFLGFWVYTRRQEGGGPKIFAVSLATALIHSAASIGLAILFGLANMHVLDATAWPRLAFVLFALETIVIGGAVAAGLFGLYLYTSSRFLDMNHNDAFTSMRRNTHRNFVRIRIKGEEAHVFAIGLDRIPRRREWRMNVARSGAPAPAYVADPPLAPHLIEAPVVIGGDGARSV